MNVFASCRLMCFAARDLSSERLQQVRRAELHVVQHLGHRVAVHEIGHLIPAVRAEADVHRVRVAEQVVQVAEDFLIRAGEEDAEHVRLAVAELVQLEARVACLVADEAIDLAVGIARHVLNRAAAQSAPRRADGSA